MRSVRLTSLKGRRHMLHTVSKAGTVLQLFSDDMPEWGVSEAAKTLGLAKSTISEMMTTLESQGFLARTSAGRYRLGWQLLELSRTLLNTSDFYSEARTVMRELVDHWGASTSLGVLNGSQLIFVERLQSSSRLKALLSQMNRSCPIYATSIGKVLLAFQKRLDVAKLLETQGALTFTPNKLTSPMELEQELEQVRIQGYALDKEEVFPGVCSVSAPIYDLDSNVIAGISIVIPAERFYPQQEQYITIITKAARRVSDNIGYRAKKRRVRAN